MNEKSEQLVLSSPEYERAVSDLFTTANALLSFYGEGSAVSGVHANLISGNTQLRIYKKGPEEGESLSDWYKKEPSMISRERGHGPGFAADEYFRSGGILKKRFYFNDGVPSRNYSPYGNEPPEEVAAEEVARLQAELESSTKLAPYRSPESLPKQGLHRRIARAVLRR